MPVEELEETVSFGIVQLVKAHRQRANELLRPFGLHAGQELVLSQLWQRDGLPQLQLAAVLHVDISTITRTVQRLEKTGLVKRCPDPEDARVSQVHLTEQGRELREPIKRAWQVLEEETTHGLSEAELLLLRRLLSHMTAQLS